MASTRSSPLRYNQQVPTQSLVQEHTQEKSSTAAARAFLRAIIDRLEMRPFAVQLWDGERWLSQAGGPARFTFVFRTPNAVHGMFSRASSLSFGEAYIYGHIDVEGPLAEVFEVGDQLMTIPWSLVDKIHLAHWLWSIPAPNYPREGAYSGFNLRASLRSPKRLHAAVNYHYDRPVEFWRLWLDKSLSYSCAYFESLGTSLAKAQKAKLDLICRKLRLRPGQRLLDMGCGWGALVMHAAEHYGVNALGLTLSQQQANTAGERIRAAGLESRCRIEIGNFLELDGQETFDRIASVGAAEHVPEKQFDGYFKQAFNLLRPGGQFLHHAIARNPNVKDRPGRSFIDHYVFPDHFLATIGRTTSAAEAAGFEVRDVESLREHYELTLNHWLQRFEAQQTEIEQQTDPLSFRVFRLYLAGSAHAFRSGRVNLYQTLMTKPVGGQSYFPLTRADWYNSPSFLREHIGEAVNV